MPQPRQLRVPIQPEDNPIHVQEKDAEGLEAGRPPSPAVPALCDEATEAKVGGRG